MGRPSSITPFLAQMEKRKPKELLRNAAGFYLEHSLREKMTEKYGQRKITVQVTKMLLTFRHKSPTPPSVSSSARHSSATVTGRSGQRLS